MADPASERVQFVVNARSLRTPTAVGALRTAVRRVFPAAAWDETPGPGSAIVLAREAAERGAGLVVAVGGDGTVNEVANGLATSGRPAPVLGVVPTGSGSDFARSVGIPRDPGAALAVLASGRRWRIDLGEITCAPLEPAAGPDPVRRYFVNVAGCGASAHVTELFNRRRIPGRLGYGVAAALTTIGYRWPRVEIRAEDGSTRLVELNTFFVCNGEYCGGGMRVGRGARLDDGRFLLVQASGIGRIRTMLQWPRLYGGRIAGIPGVRLVEARRVEVRPVFEPSARPDPTSEVKVDCDGEICGRLPATYTIEPGALTVCAP